MKRQAGFGTIAAIVIIVILAALASAIVAIGNAQQISSAQDTMSVKAWQASKAGNEWGLYKALKGSWSSCNGVSQTLDLTADSGFYVTVFCDSQQFSEGVDDSLVAKTVRFYEIRAVACTVNGCPSADAAQVASLGYVERTRVVVASSN